MWFRTQSCILSCCRVLRLLPLWVVYGSCQRSFDSSGLVVKFCLGEHLPPLTLPFPLPLSFPSFHQLLPFPNPIPLSTFPCSLFRKWEVRGSSGEKISNFRLPSFLFFLLSLCFLSYLFTSLVIYFRTYRTYLLFPE